MEDCVERLLVTEQDLQDADGPWDVDLIDLERLLECCGYEKTEIAHEGSVVWVHSTWEDRSVRKFRLQRGRSGGRALPVGVARDIVGMIRQKLHQEGYL